jgi:hypothetical protein
MPVFREPGIAAAFNPFEFYLGPHTSDPTVDNDGDPLVEGSYYWNTTQSRVRFYNGSAWTDLVVSVSGVTSPVDFGGVGNGIANDTTAVAAALSTGADVDLLGLTWLVDGGTLTMSTSFQKLYSSKGTGRLQKRTNGDLLTVTGSDCEFENVVLLNEGASFTGNGFTISGTRPSLINCGSVNAAGFAVKYTGTGRIRIEGTNTGYNTTNTTASGWDIDIGVSGTATLYHYLEDIYTSQATGGIRFTDCGSQAVIGGQFGKLSILSGTSPAGVNGGKTIGARILGNVVINLSSAIFSSNQFNSGTSVTLGASTSGCRIDESNTSSGVTFTNNGNANNLITREVSSGSYQSLSWGTHGNAQFSFSPSSPFAAYVNTRLVVGANASASNSKALDLTAAITGAGTTVILGDASALGQSDVTNNLIGWRSTLGTVAALYTLSNLRHFQAQQGTFGASSTVTNQEGFRADSSLIGATNNFGFRGLIAAATGRWNLYMDGTAFNYLNGGLAIGTTSTTAAKLYVLDSVVGARIETSVNTAPPIQVVNATTSGNAEFIQFYTEASGSPVLRGSITYNRGAAQTAYNVTSDERLKENIVPSIDAGWLLDQINVVSFKWKDSESSVRHGVIAQQLYDIVPEAVTPGDEERQWQVDYSKLVPLLVKEVQELRKRVAELESK